jgi:hypothetical protein
MYHYDYLLTPTCYIICLNLGLLQKNAEFEFLTEVTKKVTVPVLFGEIQMF